MGEFYIKYFKFYLKMDLNCQEIVCEKREDFFSDLTNPKPKDAERKTWSGLLSTMDFD